MPEQEKRRSLDIKNFSGKKTAVALGMFDGVHTGHRAVFDRTKSFEDICTEAAVFTFDTGSLERKHGRSYRYIIPNRVKLDMIRKSGIKNILCADFSELKEVRAEEFAGKILAEKMNASVVVCGPDFRFGKGAACGVEELRKFGRRYGFEVSIVSPVIRDGEVISSSGIRKLLLEGSIKKANKFLGYEYTITQSVSDGKHIGRTIDFPTVNQVFSEGQLIPAYGVYAASTVIDGKAYSAVTNIGVKPTVTDERIPLAETHIIGYSGDLYGRVVRVSLSEYLRSEKKFNSLGELKAQIARDTETVKSLGGI